MPTLQHLSLDCFTGITRYKPAAFCPWPRASLTISWFLPAAGSVPLYLCLLNSDSVGLGSHPAPTWTTVQWSVSCVPHPLSHPLNFRTVTCSQVPGLLYLGPVLCNHHLVFCMPVILVKTIKWYLVHLSINWVFFIPDRHKLPFSVSIALNSFIHLRHLMYFSNFHWAIG